MTNKGEYMTKIKKLKEKGTNNNNLSAEYGVEGIVRIFKNYFGNSKRWIVDTIELSNFDNDVEPSDFSTYKDAKEYAEHFIK